MKINPEPKMYKYPFTKFKITSPFNLEREAPKEGASTYHDAIDVATPNGTLCVDTIGGGRIETGYDSRSGKFVKVWYDSIKMYISFSHLSEQLVKTGDITKIGTELCKTGKTGVATGYCLHFKCRINGVAVDPQKHFQW